MTIVLPPEFDPAVYCKQNPYLSGLSDVELSAHFSGLGYLERRCYANFEDDHDRFSMRWLRGKGIEIGAGTSPTPLFGDATTTLADVDPSLAFGGSRYDHLCSLDDPQLIERLGLGTFDFAIASQVLEHVASILRGFKNLIDLVKPGRIVYLALSIKEYLQDYHWMPHLLFEHHVNDPLKIAHHHDGLITGYRGQPYHSGRPQIPQNERFLHHKHNCVRHNWTALLMRSPEFLGTSARLVDSCVGRQRQDCNFMLQK